MELKNRTILVTGSNRGIGHALCARLISEPVRLLAGVRDLNRFEPFPGGVAEVVPVRMDLASRESIEACAAELGEELERVDVLVNNAGEWVGGPLADTSEDDIYEVVQANLAATLHLTRFVLPHMLRRRDGKIVNQSSIVAYNHVPGTAVYSATKAGITALTNALRRELEGSGVTTLELITGGTDTDMLDQAAADLGPHTDTSKWESRDPDEWADMIVAAIEDDDERLEPSGKSKLARLAGAAPSGLMDQVSKRVFDR